MRTYAHHFTTGLHCEARGCERRTPLLWPAGTGLVRACTKAHADDAAQERFDTYMAVGAAYLDAEDFR